MADLVVGCPIARREYLLTIWHEMVEKACEEAGLVPEYVFVVPEWDNAGKDALRLWRLKRRVDLIEVIEPPLPDHRNWGPTRVQHLVELRNYLLNRVRQIGPKYFWSLDSDVLPRHDYLVRSLETIEKYDCSAVGGHLYLSMLGRHHGSKAFLDPGNQMTTRRVEETQLQGVYPTDVVMASVLMKPNAYKVDYVFNREGEDLGWSIACKEAGLRFMWDARALAKHIMHPEDLNKVDGRVGF